MEALTAAVVMAGAVALVERLSRHRLAREAQRHAWRVELVKLRADAFKADEVEKLSQRVQKLELKGLR